MSTTKILHINIADSGGGAAIAAYRLHQLMNSKMQFRSKMLVLIKNTQDDSVYQLSKVEYQKSRLVNLINNLLCKFKKYKGSFSFALIGNVLYKNALVQEADVIYIHWVNNGIMSLTNIEQILSLNKPVFLFGHDMWYFTGGCHQSNGCEKFMIGCIKCPFFDNKILQKLIEKKYQKKKNTYRKYPNVTQILPSFDFSNKVLKSGIINSTKIHFIPNILDTEKFIPSVNKVNKSKIRILYGALGGKDNPYKGWKDFEYMAKEISKSYKDKIEISLFGYDFTDEELMKLPFYAKSYGIIKVESLLIKMYQDSDVFIFPSNQESFGQTLYEAMSCGVIPISYKVGFAPDIITNSVNGFIVEIGDKEALIDAFQRIMVRDIDLLKQNVRKSVTENFSKEAILEKHIKLIKTSL